MRPLFFSFFFFFFSGKRSLEEFSSKREIEESFRALTFWSGDDRPFLKVFPFFMQLLRNHCSFILADFVDELSVGKTI